MTDVHRPSAPETVYGWVGARFSGAPAALFALDAVLADVMRTTSQPIVGQMRLTWWHEAVSTLATRVPAHPVLQTLAREVLPLGVAPHALATIVEGWEALLEQPVAAAAVQRHGERGSALFTALARCSGSVEDEQLLLAGRGWAWADLAAHATDPAAAMLAAADGRGALARVLASRWRGDRGCGALARDASMAIDGSGRGDGPRRGARILTFALTAR